MTEPEERRPPGRVVVPDRNGFERTLRAVREVLTIVVLALLAFFMVVSLAAVKAIGDRFGESDDPGVGVIEPAPTDTGCAPDDQWCGN